MDTSSTVSGAFLGHSLALAQHLHDCCCHTPTLARHLLSTLTQHLMHAQMTPECYPNVSTLFTHCFSQRPLHSPSILAQFLSNARLMFAPYPLNVIFVSSQSLLEASSKSRCSAHPLLCAPPPSLLEARKERDRPGGAVHPTCAALSALCPSAPCHAGLGGWGPGGEKACCEKACCEKAWRPESLRRGSEGAWPGSLRAWQQADSTRPGQQLSAKGGFMARAGRETGQGQRTCPLQLLLGLFVKCENEAQQSQRKARMVREMPMKT